MWRLLSIVGLVSVFTAPAFAQPPPDLHPDPQIEAWFNGQHDAAGMSCCGASDGHLIDDDQWRIGKVGYEVSLGGAWQPVTERAAGHSVGDPEGNPTGRAVVWALPGNTHILCFRPGFEA